MVFRNAQKQNIDTMTAQEVEVLINKCLAGSATEEEMRLLESLEEKAEQSIQEEVFISPQQENRARARIFQNIRRQTQGKKGHKRAWYAIAASVALLVGIALFLFYQEGPVTVANHSPTPLTVLLEDSTQVTLNEGASLTYLSSYNHRDRQVSLVGEAFFRVAGNKQKPFIVKSGTLYTRVVGTAFNIRQTEAHISVTVNEGAVKVYHKRDTVRLKPNQQAVFNTPSGRLGSKPVKARLYGLWAKENIVLNDITVEDLGIVFQSLYNCPVESLNDQVKQVRMSVSFARNEGLAKILKRINYVNEIQLTRKANGKIEAKLTR